MFQLFAPKTGRFGVLRAREYIFIYFRFFLKDKPRQKEYAVLPCRNVLYMLVLKKSDQGPEEQILCMWCIQFLNNINTLQRISN